ncbi:MAG: MBL fold metallo-hydrolase [Planctomycetes bacterium]|nr:MBL fold metallo-hydrolase [Planctomycetota bacterium]
MTIDRAKERVAAAVLLVQGRGDELRALLVERSPELRFFGGYAALPGGTRDAEDGPDDAEGGDEGPLRRCAVRELFEETGVLLDPELRARFPVARRGELRHILLGEDADAAADAWSAAARSELGVAEVRPLCRIRTPPFAPVRYDTLFFIAELPDGESVDIWPGELVGGGFERPRDVLASWTRGERRVVPPVLLLLELLADGDVEAFEERAARVASTYADGALHRVRFAPGILLASLRTPTLPPATTTNCALVGERALWIIDPATPYEDEQARLFALLDELRAEDRTLAGIAVTHHHPDHVGAVVATSRRYGLPVRAHPLTLERLAPGFRAGAPLHDGDRIELGAAPDGSPGWQLEAIHTPGHDRGHLCFRDTRYGSLIAGDMISTVSTIVIDPPEGHLATYLQSLQRLERLEIDTLHPAHGPAVPDARKIVRRYLRHRAQRESALLAALDAGLATAEELTARVYWDADPRLLPLAQRSLRAGLDKLVDEGRVVRRGERWYASGR